MSNFEVEVVDPAVFGREFAILEAQVFENDPLSVYAFGPFRLDDSAMDERAKGFLKPANGFTARMTRAVRKDDRATVGIAFWKFYYEPWVVPVDDKTSTTESNAVPPHNWPRGSNVELCEEIFGWADRHRETNFAGKKFAVLNILAVKQEYQRQGVGALLLQDGLDLADAANLPLWLGSSVPALGLYQKNLFKLEGAKSIDLKKYGGETVETHMVMIRPAQSPGSQVRLDSEKAT